MVDIGGRFSPLFLYRNGKLSQLNEDHSMAPQIDFMVKSGLMDAETGQRTTRTATA